MICRAYGRGAAAPGAASGRYDFIASGVKSDRSDTTTASGIGISFGLRRPRLRRLNITNPIGSGRPRFTHGMRPRPRNCRAQVPETSRAYAGPCPKIARPSHAISRNARPNQNNWRLQAATFSQLRQRWWRDGAQSALRPRHISDWSSRPAEHFRASSEDIATNRPGANQLRLVKTTPEPDTKQNSLIGIRTMAFEKKPAAAASCLLTSRPSKGTNTHDHPGAAGSAAMPMQLASEALALDNQMALFCPTGWTKSPPDRLYHLLPPIAPTAPGQTRRKADAKLSRNRNWP